MPPSAAAGETTGGYRATGGDAPAVLRAPVVGARRVVRTPVVSAWIGVGIEGRGHMARSEIRMVWRWRRGCGCVGGAGMAVMCWGRWDVNVVEVGSVVGCGLVLA
eukprot:scaffold25708_cov32-Phaeocystis_antarctica.AAC.1